MVFHYLLIFLLSLASFLWYYFTRTFSFWKKRNVIGPKPIPFFGNLKESALRKKNLSHLFKIFYDDFHNEKVVGIYRMTTPCLVLRDLDVIKHVLIKDFDVFEDRGIDFSNEGLGANLFHASGDIWRLLRNKFTPLFTTAKLKNMTYLITERADCFLRLLKDVTTNKPEQEIHSLLQKYTISTIAACAFGLEIETLDNNLTDTLKEIDNLIFIRSFFQELDMMYPGILKVLNLSIFPIKVQTFFRNLVTNVINERNGRSSNRKDFIDLILDLKNQRDILDSKKKDDEKLFSLKIDEGLIAAQAFVFYAAGYETSATTMAFMLYELAVNPHVQDKLIDEIDKVLNMHDGVVTYDTVSQLVYMDKVFDETLRKYPLLELQRHAKFDYKIPGTNVTINKGQTVIVSPFGIHYDEKYYPNPEKFDPERFSTENKINRHPCAFMPFGLGPRNCIGMRFAKIQSRMCVLKLLSSFRVEPSENTRNITFDPHRILISPKGGIVLKLIPRKCGIKQNI